jgi:TonB-dependent SusC/RagA subfamily outer membrane receptor
MKIALTIVVFFFQLDGFSQAVKDSSKRVVFRCRSSLSYPTKPLIVIDGIPRDSVDMSTINTAMIQSIAILKGSSATAIYGIRGMEGVIIITMKCEARIPQL